MSFDLVLSGENQTRLISCLKSITESEYELKKITIIIVTQCFEANSNSNLDSIIIPYKKIYKDIKIICSKTKPSLENIIKFGFISGNSDYICFLGNSLVLSSTLNEIINSMDRDKCCILGELRCLPTEEPSVFDPLTLIIEWFQGNPFVVKRVQLEDLFKNKHNISVASFNIHKLNLKIRFNGYTMKYLPTAVVFQEENSFKIFENCNFIIGNLYLCWLQGKLLSFYREYKAFIRLFIVKDVFSTRIYLSKNFLYHFLQIFNCLKWRFIHKKDIAFKNSLLEFAQKVQKNTFNAKQLQNPPKVSVIVRTCGRPNVLKETLISLRNQTYKNFEVIVYEDGENISEVMVTQEFPDLNIKYYYSGKKVGRCVTANKAMALAVGKYFNFLDDDDIFLPDHLEVLVGSLENSTYRIAYTLALQTSIRVTQQNPYVYEVISYDLIYKQPFNRLLLFFENYLPIQSVMFDKNLFLELGGFNENLDALEDWDLWVRYACKNDFLSIDKITSIYRVPSDLKKYHKREKQYQKMLDQVRKNQDSYCSKLKVSDCARDVQGIIDLYLSRNRIQSFIKRLKMVLKNLLKQWSSND